MIDPSKYGKNVKHVLNAPLLNLNTTLLPEMWLLTYLSPGREIMMVFRPENTKSRCQSSFFDAISSHWEYVASLKSKIVTKMLAVMRCINSALTSQHYSMFTLIIRYCWCLNGIQEDAECWSQCIPCCGLFYMHKNSRTIIDYMWLWLWHNV